MTPSGRSDSKKNKNRYNTCSGVNSPDFTLGCSLGENLALASINSMEEENIIIDYLD